MRWLAALRGLGVGVAGGMALALFESLLALLGQSSGPTPPGQAPPSFTEDIAFFLSIDVALGLALGALLAPLGALLARSRHLGWSAAAGAICLLAGVGELGVLAKGVAPGLQAAKSWRASTPLPMLRGQGRSIVLISVDTWRADSLEHMPKLATRAQTAWRFERAHSTASWTLPAMASLMTGLSVHEHGAGRSAHPTLTGIRTGISPQIPLLAERLQEQGYVNVGVLSNAYLGPSMGFHRGLDRVVDASSRATLNAQLRRSLVLRALLPERLDDGETLVAMALQRWRRLEQGRGFLWVHLSDPHAPYGQADPCEMPACFPSWVPVRRGEQEADRGAVRALYEQDLARLDVALEELLVHIDTQRTLVVLVGDHGESFGAGQDIEHGQSYGHSVTQVPLMIWGPGLAPQDISRAVDLRDVHAAILQWAETGQLQALEAGAEDSLTPLASLLYGPKGSACTDGTNTLQRRGQGVEVLEGSYRPELAACIPSALPAATEGVELEGALRVLGYVE